MKQIITIFISLLIFGSVAKAQNEDTSNVEMAQICNYIGDSQSALDYAEKEIALNSKSAAAYLEAGIALYNLDQNSRAVNMLEKAMKHGKKNVEIIAEACRYLGHIYANEGDSSKALKYMDKGLNAQKDNQELLISRISVLYNVDRKKAEEEIGKMERLHPKDDEMYMKIASAMWGSGDLKKALEMADKAIKINSNSAVNFLLRGVIKDAAGDKEGALSDYIMSYLIDPNQEAMSMLKDITPSEQKYVLSKIESLKSSYDKAEFFKALVLIHWEQIEEAEAILEKICNSDAADEQAYQTLASLQHTLNGTMQAYSTINEGLIKFPNSPDLLKYKALLLADFGKPDDGLDIIDRLLDKDPDCEGCLNVQGHAYLVKGDYNNAVVSYGKSLEKNEYNADVLKELLISLKLAGEEETAEEIAWGIVNLDEAQLSGDFKPAYYKMIAYTIMGNKHMAEELAKDALDIKDQGIEYFVNAIIQTWCGEENKAVENLKKAMIDLNRDLSGEIYDPLFYPLHNSKEFGSLVNDINDVKVKKDWKTGLYRFDRFVIEEETNVKSYEDVLALDSKDFGKWIKEVNRMCPVSVPGIGFLTKVVYDEKLNTIKYFYETNPEMMDIDVYKNNPKLIEKSTDVMGLQLLIQYPAIQRFPGSISWIYTTPDRKKSFTTTLDQKKLKKLAVKANSQKEIDEMTIDLMIEIENSSPDNNVEVSKDKKNINHLLKMNIGEAEWNSLEIFHEEMRNEWERTMPNYIPKRYAESMIRLGLGLNFKYIHSQTGREVDLNFTPGELSRIFNYYP